MALYVATYRIAPFRADKILPRNEVCCWIALTMPSRNDGRIEAKREGISQCHCNLGILVTIITP